MLAINEMQLFSSYYSKEIICLVSSLNTSDPGNIFDTIMKMEKQVLFECNNNHQNIKCSVLCYSGEVFVYQRITQVTKGNYQVPLDIHDVQYFLSKAIEPPIVDDNAMIEERAKMKEINQVGFPKLNVNVNVFYLLVVVVVVFMCS